MMRIAQEFLFHQQPLVPKNSGGHNKTTVLKLLRDHEVQLLIIIGLQTRGSPTPT